MHGKRCFYKDIIDENRFMYTDVHQNEIINPEEILPGGEYRPKDCSPLYSTAIIIVYRNREVQLKKFLIYFHNYLRQQKIHYRIFVIEQADQKLFNRAKLFNIGAVTALRHNFPCLVLQDVDLMPLKLGQMYACTYQPRHMCSSLDQFRFNLPYRGLFGGAIAIRAQQYQAINGMSNLFQGWGGEDDDFFERLKSKNIDICRFERAYSYYTMLKHAKEKPSEDRLKFLKSGPLRYHTDGLNSLVYVEKEIVLKDLYTHVLAET